MIEFLIVVFLFFCSLILVLVSMVEILAKSIVVFLVCVLSLPLLISEQKLDTANVPSIPEMEKAIVRQQELEDAARLLSGRIEFMSECIRGANESLSKIESDSQESQTLSKMFVLCLSYFPLLTFSFLFLLSFLFFFVKLYSLFNSSFQF